MSNNLNDDLLGARMRRSIHFPGTPQHQQADLEVKRVEAAIRDQSRVPIDELHPDFHPDDNGVICIDD